MGWKASCIFILPREKQNLELVKNTLGFDKMTKSEPEPFEVAINPYKKCYIGYLDNKLIICHPDWPNEIILGETSILRKLENLFPNSKILVIGLQSVINYYAFAMYENGILLRKKYGDSDKPLREDLGELLLSEKEFIEDQIVRIENNELGKRYFFKDDSEAYEEDAIGVNFVSCVTKEIFAYELFEMDENPLFEVELEGFEYKEESNSSIKSNTKEELSQKRISRIKQYSKLAIIVVCILLIRKFGAC